MIYEATGPFKCACGGWLLWVDHDADLPSERPRRVVCADCQSEQQVPRWRLMPQPVRFNDGVRA